MTSERIDPPPAGDEDSQLHGFLDYHRATLQMKAADLDATGLARTLPPSDMTLGGMLKHVALNEDNWFSVFLHGNERAEPWRDDHAIGRSRELVAGMDLATLSARRLRGADEQVTLRWIVLHTTEEYARHNGHADLIRESIDGVVGE